MSPTSRNRDKRPSERERNRRSRQSTRAGGISNRELRRQALAAIEHGRKAYATLLAVLAQVGGDGITVTQGTLDQVTEHYDDLGFVVEGVKDKPGEFIVKLVSGREEDVPADTEETPTAGIDHADAGANPQ